MDNSKSLLTLLEEFIKRIISEIEVADSKDY